jgi:hypothetical protein
MLSGGTVGRFSGAGEESFKNAMGLEADKQKIRCREARGVSDQTRKKKLLTA